MEWIKTCFKDLQNWIVKLSFVTDYSFTESQIEEPKAVFDEPKSEEVNEEPVKENGGIYNVFCLFLSYSLMNE